MARIDLIEFLRPEPLWPYPYSLEMAFSVLRWLIETASHPQFEEQYEYHRSSAAGVMGAEGAINGAGRPIANIDDLKNRFVDALLMSDRCRPDVTRWREAHGISPMSHHEMRFAHYKPHHLPAHLPWRSESEVRQALRDLLERSTGRKLAVSLNSVHKRARTIQRVGVMVAPKYFRFVLNYGLTDARKNRYDSTWTHELAMSKKGEPFLDTLARAIEHLEGLLQGTAQKAA